MHRCGDFVTLPRPGDNAAAQIDHVADALLAKKITGMIGTRTAAAVQDYILVLRQIVHAQWNQVHREVFGVRQDTLRHLGVAADIDQRDILTGIEARLELFECAARPGDHLPLDQLELLHGLLGHIF